MTRRRPTMAPRPPLSDAHHAIIAAELVRLTLGGRPDRPELRDQVEAERVARRRRHTTCHTTPTGARR